MDTNEWLARSQLLQTLNDNAAFIVLGVILVGLVIGLLFNVAMSRIFIYPINAAVKARQKRDAMRDDKRGIVAILNNLLPMSKESEDSARSSLERAGIKMSPRTFWAFRLVCLAMSIFVCVAIGVIVVNAGIASIFGGVVVGACIGLIIPQLYIVQSRRKWQDAIDRDLASALDILSVTVSAGSTIDAGMRNISARMEGPIADGFADVVEEMKYLPRARALKNFADRANVQSLTIFVASYTQAELTGAPMGVILKQQADLVRTNRRLKMEEEINKLPVKMLFPIIFLIFPALMVVLLAPAVSMFIEGFGGI